MNTQYKDFLRSRLLQLTLVMSIFSVGCIQKSKVVVTLKKNKIIEPLNVSVSHVQVINHQIIITGTNLDTVKYFKIKEGSTDTNLQIESKNNTSIVANSISNVTFAAGRVFDFILSSANGASTFTVDFSLCDSTLGGKGFNCLMAPTDKQVLSYDVGTGKWRPRSVNGLAYQGTWSALTALPATGVLIPGDYYIVSVANAPYNVGDWIVLNNDGVTFEQIENSTTVTSVFARTGNIVAAENDYDLDQMGDVDLTTSPPIVGDALVYNGMKWVPGVVSGSGGGTVTTVSGTLPISVATGSSTPVVSISQATTTTNGYLSSTDWNIFNNKEAALPTGGTTLQYFRGDKTLGTLNTSVVPENTNLYFTNARALGLILTGFDNTLIGQVAATDTMLQAFGRVQNQINSLSSGGSNYLIKNGPDTLSGAISLTNVITATGAGDIVVNSVPLTITSAVNKTYADGKLDKTTGGTVAGVVTLDNDLKFKGGTNYVTIKGHATSANYNFILPSSAGTAGYVLSTDGSGNTSWITAAGGGAPTGAAGGDLSGTYPNPTITALDAAKVGGGVVSNAEFSYLDGITSSIQTQLNAKEPAITTGTTAQYLRGDKTLSTFANDIWATVLTGLSTATNSVITATDSILVAFGKLQAQISGQATTISSQTTLIGTKADTTNIAQTITALAVTGLATPVANSDAANKAYVDAKGLPGNSILMYQARVATTANIILAGNQMIDAVTVVDGDRVLVKNQSASEDNGIYIVAAGAWSRAADFDTWSEAIGYHAQISEGDSWNGMIFVSGVISSGILGSTGMGWSAVGNTLNTENTANGYQALDWNTTGYQNIANGHYALVGNTTGYRNAANGYSTLMANSTGSHNTATGYAALRNNTVGSDNTATGSLSLRSNTDGVHNTATGVQALYTNISGSDNAATGTYSLFGNTLGAENVANGISTLYGNTIGNYNTAVGSSALRTNVGKNYATAIGYNSMYYAHNTTSNVDSNNTALGAFSLRGGTTAASNTGIQNTALGASALKVLTSGSSNIGIGYNSGAALTTGSNNVIIGSNTGSTIATSSNNILISDGAGAERARINSSGFFGINNTAPGSELDVKGTLRLSGSTSGYVGFAPAAAAGSTTYTLPSADGSAGQLLRTNGAGVLSWVTDSTGGGAFSGTASRAVATDGAGALTTLTTTSTELGYVNGVTSSIQTQLNAKEPTITAGSASQYLKGDKTLGTFLTDIMNSLLTGVSFATNSAITAADNLLAALGKLQAQVTSLASTKLDKTGGTLSIGTISGVPTPTNADDVVNKGYVDGFGQWTKTGGDIYRSTGSVGIGTATPAVALDVQGQIRTKTNNNTGLTTIDWDNGNIQYTTDSCQSYTFDSVEDGASYTFTVKGATAAQCTFTTAGLTYHYTPSNGPTNTSTHTIYSFFRAGDDVYVSWVSGL